MLIYRTITILSFIYKGLLTYIKEFESIFRTKTSIFCRKFIQLINEACGIDFLNSLNRSKYPVACIAKSWHNIAFRI